VKRALVIGSAGQDGRILTAQLRAADTSVIGADRHGTMGEGMPAPSPPLDLGNLDAVESFVRAALPDEIYYLAAHHHSSEEAIDTDIPGLFRLSIEVNVTGLVHVLEAMRRTVPQARLFYASSSHVFGRPALPVQDERTPKNPINVYGLTKSAGMDAVRFYRERGLHASAGILYNHESIYRTEKFVSMRLARAAARAALAIQNGEIHRIEVGSLAAVVDWGYAPDYTLAMQRIVALETPDDFVVASGQPHRVEDLARAAFAAVGLDWREHVFERPGIVKKPGAVLVGDASKLKSATGWAPSITFGEMVERLARGVL
jgi:GDPmannose 4,6-dehydratase